MLSPSVQICYHHPVNTDMLAQIIKKEIVKPFSKCSKMLNLIRKFLFPAMLMITTSPHKKLYAETEFLPFKGYRPRLDLIQKIVCPPYNALSASEARDMVNNNEHSFLHISRPEVDLQPSTLPYDELAGIAGKKTLEKFIQKGWLIQDEKPCFYLYEQQAKGHKIMSIIGNVAIKHYLKGSIKKHEETIPEKESALTSFIERQQAHTDPVVLIYQKKQELQQLIDIHAIQTPATIYQAPDESIHTLWAIDNPVTIKHIQHLFSSVKSLYIADGHHRCAATLNLLKKSQNQNHKHLLAALIPNSTIKLASYNRIIRTLNGMTNKEFLAQVAEKFDITQKATALQAQPASPRRIAMFLGNSWYELKAKSSLFKEQFIQEKTDSLDLSLVDNHIIKPLLKISSLNNIENIEGVGGVISLAKLEEKCRAKKWQLAFAFHPVSISTFIELVEQGALMPAKTTWFEPKIWQGLVVQKL